MTDTRDEQRAAFLQSLKEGVTESDTLLADAVLNRAVTDFMHGQGKNDHAPYSRQDLERAFGKNSAMMMLIDAAEEAIAVSRIMERERCARIAEKMHDDFDVLDICQKVAAQIRTGKAPRPGRPMQ